MLLQFVQESLVFICEMCVRGVSMSAVSADEFSGSCLQELI